MKKEKRNPRSHELIREMIELYHPQSIRDIQEMLKDMFADTMEDMLKAELDTERLRVEKHLAELNQRRECDRA